VMTLLIPLRAAKAELLSSELNGGTELCDVLQLTDVWLMMLAKISTDTVDRLVGDVIEPVNLTSQNPTWLTRPLQLLFSLSEPVDVVMVSLTLFILIPKKHGTKITGLKPHFNYLN